MPTKTETLVLELDPTIPLETQIQRGNYNYTNPAINAKNFSLTLPAGKREIVLYDPKGFVSSEEMIVRIKADGCVPATLDDALAMGQQHPDRQRQNIIVFLGTVWQGGVGGRSVPVLGGGMAGVDWRGLVLDSFDFDWSVLCRFAAVREK